jgi:hypothetical protein
MYHFNKFDSTFNPPHVGERILLYLHLHLHLHLHLQRYSETG